MWKSTRMWGVRRHAARAFASSVGPLPLGAVANGSQSSSGRFVVASAATVAALCVFASANLPTHADAESANANVARGVPLSKEHMRLARRFTRRSHQKFHRYVIVGCGTAAHAAIEAIRQSEPNADILVLSDERALPRHENHSAGSTDSGSPSDAEAMADALMETYNEWRRHIAQRLEEDPNDTNANNGSLANGGAGGSHSANSTTTLLMKQNTKMHFDVEKNRILLSDGTEIRYEKCLIACSGRPRHFYVLDSDRISYALKDRINLCTTYNDFEQLNGLNKRTDITNVTVVGGGFLGTEVATAIATDPRNQHLKTQLIFVESAPEGRSLPLYLARDLGAKLTAAGVEVIADRLVTSLKTAPDQDAVAITALGNGKHKLLADYVVLASTHTDPNLRLDRQTCFEIDDVHGGIVVNAQLEAMAGVFVAGNAASYFDPYIGRRRVDRYDHAVNSGLLAGHNMVSSTQSNGKMKLYRHQPLFRSNLSGIDVQIEGLGVIDASLKTVGVWVQKAGRSRDASAVVPPPSYDRGVVYYLKGNKVVGVLLWNASDVLESARQLMHSRPEVHDHVEEELKEVISLGPDDWLHVVST